MAAEVNHSARAHALLSASGASRWINCTPSPRLEEGFKDKRSSYADEGTLAHEFAEFDLLLALGRINQSEYDRFTAPLRESEHYTDEMQDEVAKHVDYVMQQYNEARRITPDALLLVEYKLDLTHYIEEGFGTNDVVIIADGVLEVIDLKYGKGIRVKAEDNPQLKLYGLGSLRAFELSYDINTVRLTVTQPRMDSISSWELSAEDLRVWGEEVVKPKAIEAYAGKGELKAGNWCQFCKAKARCRALAELSLEAAKHEFKDPNLLDDKEVLEIFEKSGIISSWLDSVGSYILAEALKGKKWDGLKPVEGRSNRTILAATAPKVHEKLEALGFTPVQFTNSKLKGIGDLEKLVGKNKFNEELGEFITKPQGKPTLVPDNDPRPLYGEDQAKKDFAE